MTIDFAELTDVESNRLFDCETTIERGLGTFVEVGTALLEIRDTKLYRLAHKTFEDYCQERWKMTRQRASQLITASEAVGNLSTIVDKPRTEGVARPLTQLEPDQQQEAWAEALAETDGNPTAADVQRVVDQKLGKPHVSHNSGDNEWYTPEEYVTAARDVLGRIDLDPASSTQANKVVKAKRFFSLADNGLAQEWGGRIWMNPPYASGLIDKFADKLTDAYIAGCVEAAIVLVNNATETQWFQGMARATTAICFPERRIRFWSPEGEQGAPLQGQAFLYMGGDHIKFIRRFVEFGIVVEVRSA